MPGDHTGVATSDDKESTGVTDTEDDNMAVINAAIAEVVATLDQELRETNTESEETEFPEADKDVEVSHPNTTTKTTRRVYNLCKGKNVNCGRNYSHRFGYHPVALVHIALTAINEVSIAKVQAQRTRISNYGVPTAAQVRIIWSPES